jgi:hypothetical protein
VPLPEFLVTMLPVRLSPETTPAEPVFANTRLSWRDLGQVGKWIRQARDTASYPWLTAMSSVSRRPPILDAQQYCFVGRLPTAGPTSQPASARYRCADLSEITFLGPTELGTADTTSTQACPSASETTCHLVMSTAPR